MLAHMVGIDVYLHNFRVFIYFAIVHRFICRRRESTVDVEHLGHRDRLCEVVGP